MKYFLFIIMLFYSTNHCEISSVNKTEEPYVPAFFLSQQAPFYFLNSIPAAVKLAGKINLSFFRNQSIVFQYRYRLELPNGVISDIDRRFITWSPWTKDNLTEFMVPRLDQEGGYKLIIEYMTPELGETRKFEKPFYVYRENPKINDKIAESKTVPMSNEIQKTAPNVDKTSAKTTTEIDKTSVKQTTATNKTLTDTKPVTAPIPDQTESKTASNAISATDKSNKQNEPANANQVAVKDSKKEIASVSVPSVVNISTAPSEKNKDVEKSVIPDYNKLLAEAIENKDANLFRNSIQNGANCNIKSTDGGNIFHIIDGTLANEEMISTLKSRGISINEPDSYGNSPLHVAVLEGKKEYATLLINQGADLNLKNNLELAPLHIAAFLDDNEVVEHLLNKGAELNLKGNSGYTPLHIASEMNHMKVAKDLLLAGAKDNLKTDQKLTPKAIARIQNNPEMYKMIGKKGSYGYDSQESYSATSITPLHPVSQNPKYDFNLPYDNRLVKKRQFNKVVQIISMPIFIAGTYMTTRLNHEANNYYSLYKRAESEAKARVYYDKTKRYDSYTYISGGISLMSLYGFIHSTSKKKSISNKMYKTFN
jgi:ankyrin repeat protein